MNAKDHVLKLNEILTKKLSLVEELLLFTRSQKTAIVEGRFEDNDTIIGEKQLRINAIDKLDHQFLVCSSSLKELLSITSFEDLPRSNVEGTAELKGLTAKIHEKLKEIKAIDDENSVLIKKELEKAKGQIDHANRFKRVTGAYYPANSDSPSYYYDKKK